MVKSVVSKNVRHLREKKFGPIAELLQATVGDLIEEGEISLKKVAELALVSPATLRNFINFRTKSPSFDVVLGILNAYGIDLQLLMGNKPNLRLDQDLHKPSGRKKEPEKAKQRKKLMKVKQKTKTN